MNDVIEIIKAIANKPIKAEIKNNLGLTYRGYIYTVYSNSYVVTKEYVSDYVKPADRDSNFKSIKYTDINGIKVTA